MDLSESNGDDSAALGEASVDAPLGTSEIIVRRHFQAKVSDVFRAFTDKRLFSRWTAAEDAAIRMLEFDAQTGGRWSYELQIVPGQPAFGFRGVFHEVRADELIVQTFEFDRAPGVVTLTTTAFLPGGYGTTVETVSLFPSERHRDEVLQAGMKAGADAGYRRLEALLAESAR